MPKSKKANSQEVRAFSLATPNLGDRNQILGAFHILSELTGATYDFEKAFLLPEGVSSCVDVKDFFAYSNYKRYADFRTAVWKMLDQFLNSQDVTPKIFVTAYGFGKKANAAKNVDKLCCAVKEYYEAHELGKIITVVLTSPAYKYKSVDIINVPKHLLTLRTRVKLLRTPKLRKKTLITTGILHNFSRRKVEEQNKNFCNILEKSDYLPELQNHIQKLKNFITSSKKIVFCLGGRVDGPEIQFDVSYARKLLNDAKQMAHNGYGIIFVNGPRTPNEVADFLYENTQNQSNIVFHNCKKVADNDTDRAPSRWRIYSGKNEKDFAHHLTLGNIYPAVIGFPNTLTVHTQDSFASCETSSAFLPTAVSAQGLYIDPEVRYDCLNLHTLLCPRYAIDWDEFLNLSNTFGFEPKDLKMKVLPNPLRVFAEICLNRLNGD